MLISQGLLMLDHVITTRLIILEGTTVKAFANLVFNYWTSGQLLVKNGLQS